MPCKRLLASVLAALSFLLALPLLTPDPAAAATVEIVERAYCNIRLSGPIEDGDLKKILAAVEQVEARNEKLSEPERLAREANLVGGSNNLCLDSPGGSLAEALRIMEHFAEHVSIGTVVDRGEACHSVCAFVFMTGRYVVYHAITAPVRRLHVEGVLGFRTPPFRAQAGTHDRAVVQQAYADGARVIAELLKQDQRNDSFRDRDRVLPRALMLQLLGREPEDGLLVETVDQAGRWGIELIGHRQPKEITGKMLLQACVNEGRWREGIGGMAVPAGASEAPVKLEKSNHRTTFQGLGAAGDITCTADVFHAGERGFFIDIHASKSGPKHYAPDLGFFEEQVNKGSDQSKVGLTPGTSLWGIFPPETKLSALRAQ
jgi:hypothetical protein